MNISICMKSRFLLLIVFFGFFSCHFYNDEITKWHYTSDELEKWLIDSSNLRFFMVDQNGISREFVNFQNVHDFSEGRSYFAGVNYSISQRENFYQNFGSNYNDVLSASINPAYDDCCYGERFTFSLNSLSFTYDFLLEMIVLIETNCNYLNLLISSEGVEDEPLICSKVEFVDEFQIGQTTYSNVLHFVLSDFKSDWAKYTVTEVYYAQQIGLLSYKYNNGLVFNRK